MRLTQNNFAGKARLMLLNLIKDHQLTDAEELILAILNATPQNAAEIDEQRQRILQLKVLYKRKPAQRTNNYLKSPCAR